MTFDFAPALRLSLVPAEMEVECVFSDSEGY